MSNIIAERVKLAERHRLLPGEVVCVQHCLHLGKLDASSYAGPALARIRSAFEVESATV